MPHRTLSEYPAVYWGQVSLVPADLCWRRPSVPRRWQMTFPVVLLTLLVGGLANPAGAGVTYSVTDLGTLGGTNSYAWGINDLGQVVGRSASPTGSHAFVYNNGVMSDLGTLGGTYSAAFKINDSGVITGQSSSSENSSRRAFVYSNGQMTYLGAGLGWNAWTESFAISANNSGQVVGYRNYTTSNFPQFPPPWTKATGFVYSGGTTTMLSPPAGYDSTEALAINDAGQIAGIYYDTTTYPNSQAYAFLDTAGVITTIAAGACGDTAYNYFQSGGFDINSSGDVIGVLEDSGGFLYRNGQTTSLGTDFLCNAINDAGQIVGNGSAGPTLYQDGEFIDLTAASQDNPGWTLSKVTDINNHGQIVGYGYNPSGQRRAFLLDPVPEPSTVVLLGLGGLLVARRKRT